MELSCQSCGHKATIQSFLTAAQTPCGRCGQLLMGSLGQGVRVQRSAPVETAPAGTLLEPVPYESAHPVSVWSGVVVGVLIGLGAVLALGYLGAGMPHAQRGAWLGALSGVLLIPFIVIGSFLSMLVLPFSLEGVLGDSLWNRLANALHHRKVRPLILPLFFYAFLPMCLCAAAGYKMRNHAPLLVTGALGAMILGAIVGGIVGSYIRVGRRAGDACSVGPINLTSAKIFQQAEGKGMETPAS